MWTHPRGAPSYGLAATNSVHLLDNMNENDKTSVMCYVNME